MVQWSWFAWVNALCNLSSKKLQEVAASLLGRFLNRCCCTLCITMEVKLIIAKQYKCHHCCSCKKYRGKGMEDGKKGSLQHFLADQKIMSLWKKIVLGHPIARATSYCLLPYTFWLWASKNVFKVGSVKFTNSLSPPSIVKKVCTEVKAAKGLKQYWAKVKGVNNPPEPPSGFLLMQQLKTLTWLRCSPSQIHLSVDCFQLWTSVRQQMGRGGRGGGRGLTIT